MLLTELLSPDRVVVPLNVGDRHAVIAELTRHLAELADADYDEVLERGARSASRCRAPGIGFGVAIPARPLGRRCASWRWSAGVSPAPVPFDAIDGEPVRLFFLIVGPEASAGLHVKILSRIARLVRRDTVRQQLLEAAHP